MTVKYGEALSVEFDPDRNLLGNRQAQRLRVGQQAVVWKIHVAPHEGEGPTDHFVEDFRVLRGVFFGIAPADDHVWLVRRNLAAEAAETQRVADLGPVGSPGTERRGAMELVGSRLYVGTSSGLQGYELDPVRPPTRVVNLQMPSLVVSIAIQIPGR